MIHSRCILWTLFAEHVWKMLKQSGFLQRFGSEWLFPSIQAAVNHACSGERLVSAPCSRGPAWPTCTVCVCALFMYVCSCTIHECLNDVVDQFARWVSELKDFSIAMRNPYLWHVEHEWTEHESSQCLLLVILCALTEYLVNILSSKTSRQPFFQF